MTLPRMTLSLMTAATVVILILTMSYNGLASKQQTVKQAWSQVENVYQRRADLIPNLVATVKGYAGHDESTLTAVINARAKVSSISIKDALNNPQQFAQFQAAQRQLSSALGRLLVTVERYPNLKASENYLNLQFQLVSTENLITVERRRYNLAAQAFDTKIRKFPTNFIAKTFGFHSKPYFQAEAKANQVIF